MKKYKNIFGTATLLAALCILLGTQTAWAQEDPVTYQVTRAARTNNTFTFTMPSNNVETTVEYVNAGAVIRPANGATNGSDDIYYETFAEIFANNNAILAEGDKVTLLADETIGDITIYKSCTIDLNGHTLEHDVFGTALTVNANGKTVTITGASTGDPGGITSTDNRSTVIRVSKGTLIIDGGVFSSKNLLIDNTSGCNLTINGGSFTSDNADVISNSGSLTVHDGTFRGAGGINNSDTSSELTVTGGSITATGMNGNAILIWAGTFNLKGNPSFSATGTGYDAADIYLKTGMIINITGALTAPTTGETPVADPWTVISDNIHNAPTTSYTITFGFSAYCHTSMDAVADPADYFTYYNNTAGITTHLDRDGEAQFVIPNVSITTIGDKPRTLYYPRLALALDDAQNGELITMLAGEDFGTTGVTISKDVTLDLNGKTLTYTGNVSAITVSSGKIVTIKDTGTGQNPGISCTGSGNCIYNYKGMLTIKSGAFSSTYPSIYNEGLMYVEGGSFTSSSNNGTINNDGSLTVTGGTITGKNGIVSYGMNPDLTVTGGTITTTYENGCAIVIMDGTFNLSDNPTISATNEIGCAILIQKGTFNLKGNPTISTTGTGGYAADIYLGNNVIININGALTAPTTPWTVLSYNIEYPPVNTPATPYIFTSGFSANCLTSTNAVADPAAYFAYYNNTAGITTRLVNGTTVGRKEAQFLKYTALAEATMPEFFNGGQSGYSNRTPNLNEGNVWVGDILVAHTTASPADGISWQWYRVNSDGETAIEGETNAYIDISSGYSYSEYTLTAADVGYTIIAKATMAANAAGTGYPASAVTVASLATPAVEKKDNFGELDQFVVLNTDYIGVTIASAATGTEYMFIESSDAVLAEDDPRWSLATEGANVALTLNKYIAIENNVAVKKNMLPGKNYKLYYRLKETATTKHGNTSTTNDKPENEGNTSVATLPWDYRITTGGVTYELNHKADGMATETTTIATAFAVPAEGTGDHKRATFLAEIPADNAALVERIDVWSVLGYNVTGATVGNDVFTNAVSVNYSGYDTDSYLGNIGNAVAYYGYIQAENQAIYNWLKGGTTQLICTEEGYAIKTMNNGYYALCNAQGAYIMADKGKSVEQSGMTDILDAEGMTGGSVTFYDKAGVALPAGEDLFDGKFMAAEGQKVVVNVTLPKGFEFKTGADNKKINITYGNPATTESKDLVEDETTHVWYTEFTMPSKNVTVSFKEEEPIQGKAIVVEIVLPTDGSGTVGFVGSVPSTVRVLDELTFTLTPTAPVNAGDSGYELTSLGLTPAAGATATIKDATTEEVVTLPYEKPVKVTLKIAADIEGSNLSFQPVFIKSYESIAFGEGKTTYCYDKGMMLRTPNENLKFYTVTGFETTETATTATLTEITSKTIPANMPIIVENNTGQTNFNMTVVEGESSNAAFAIGCKNGDAVVTADSHFKGTAEAMATTNTDTYGPWNMAENTKYYGFNGSDFVWIKEAGDVAARKCWIEINVAHAPARIVIDWGNGTMTGISDIADDAENDDWYDLNGRKLQGMPTEKGVYINNGKKVVIK